MSELEKIQVFLNHLTEETKKWDIKSENDEINFFDIMYHGHEEERLHSRFISYLLSSNQEYLKLFVNKVLELREEEFKIENCIVRPNKDNKTEYEEIDILIYNEAQKQAIIIENKIHAEDSNVHERRNDGYDGQLERYYSTLINKKNRNGKECEYQSDKDKTYVYYLSLYKLPTDTSIGILKDRFDKNRHVIKYQQIQDWLEDCLKKTDEENLTKFITQYLKFITKMINDDKMARELTDLIGDNMDNNKSAMYLFNNFIHIKWHSIHRFFTELAESLSKEFDKLEFPSQKAITEVAHKNKKSKLIMKFEYKGAKLQIVNDEQGFTLCNLTNNTWENFSAEIKNIKFWEFTNKETFSIINKKNREDVIRKIFDEIEKFHNNDYKDGFKELPKT